MDDFHNLIDGSHRVEMDVVGTMLVQFAALLDSPLDTHIGFTGTAIQFSESIQTSARSNSIPSD